MTKVLDILKEELEIAMILSGTIQCIFYEVSNACDWGVGVLPYMCSSNDYCFCTLLVSNWLWILTV